VIEGGYIKLYRKFTKWEWYDDLNTCRVFLHLLLTVNYEKMSWRGITVEAGQRICSISKLAEETKLSIQAVRTAISHLQLTNEVTSESTTQYTVFTVINWKKYQEATNESTDVQQMSNKRTANEPQQRKNDKNEKNKENISEAADTVSLPQKIKHLDSVFLTEAEYQKLQEAIGQKSLELAIEKLDYSITVKGGKYRDHYKAILNWHKRGWIEPQGGTNGNTESPAGGNESYQRGGYSPWNGNRSRDAATPEQERELEEIRRLVSISGSIGNA